MAYQPVDIGAAPNDGTGDPIRDAFDKCNDNFVELYAGLTGLLDFKGSTDCSANPNYPAASKGDFYLVSVAGKIGGASGIVVEAGDSYFAIADNAGGTQASVGSSWTVIQGNITSYLPLSGGTLTGDLVVPAEAYGVGWNGSNEAPTKNDVYDKIESLGSASIDIEDEGTPEATGISTINFVGSGVTAADMGGGVVDVTIPGGAGSIVFGVTIDGGGSAITTGVKGFIRVPVAHTITKATLLSIDASSTSGSIVIDVWRDSYANYPPTVADTITASAKPTLSSATKSEDSTLTGWSTSGSAGDIYGFKVDSAATVTKVILEIEASI